jgi:protocatechuate 3,4-dioxygenase beta subunit
VDDNEIHSTKKESALMNRLIRTPSRRCFVRDLTLAAAFLAVPGSFAEELLKTPRQGEGPFYPDRLPLDTDNDLIIVNDSFTPAVGQITHLSGRLLDPKGDPIRNAWIEIWQADSNGVYLHTRDVHAKRDSHFQGFGRFLTGSTGEYYFRTIKPVPYPGRTPHIHFAVKMKGREKWTTQCYIKGEPRNASDSVYQAIHDPRQQAAVTVNFKPLTNSRAGELTANFDIVLGLTPPAE